ncbi:mitochondrial import inner membrane translocase subunit TIM22-3-like [Lotus japonicus]|uniref:mitochondrial import inner membrane translocase subunit TIM22-3-like n=1 Tax=Lotus japonicus TaxID=34305 RepID=UPI00258BAE97|nr:mitochondrial import inner membrane translocase subunit TIM22-3-like [Lotus japonicus]
MALNETVNPVGDAKSAPNSSNPVGPAGCLLFFAANSACGAFTGSIFGYGAGLVKKKGFKQSLIEARSNAKTFAILSGVDSLVVCILARLRGKDDAINAGIAGCCSGLAISYPGTPQELVQNCLTFGALSFIIEGLSRKQSAQALTLTCPLSSKTSVQRHSYTPPFALPLQLPLSDEMQRAFSSFCENLRKCKKDIFPTSN